MAVLEVHHLKKIYTTRLGGARVQALTDVNFSVEKGENPVPEKPHSLTFWHRWTDQAAERFF